MAGYAKELPRDKQNNVYAGGVPAFTAKQRWSGVPTSSSVVGISPDSTVIDFMCIGGQGGNAGLLGRWGNVAVSTSNYDFMVNSGQTRTFVIPVSVFGAPVNSVAGMGAQNGLYNTVAIINATAQSASVFAAEY